MFASKDISISKSLKFPNSHRNGVIQAVRNKDSSLSFLFKKRIKGLKRHPLGLLITKYHADSEIDLNYINEVAVNWTRICEQGRHPKKYLVELEEKAVVEQKQKENKERTFEWVFNKYNERKLDNGQNTESTIKDRVKSINTICPDWLPVAFASINYEKIYDRFNQHASQRNYRGSVGSRGASNTWARYMKAIWTNAIKFGYVKENPFVLLEEEMGGFQSGEEEYNYLLPSETSTIIDTMQDVAGYYNLKYGRETQLWACILLLLTGLRLNEVLSLKWQDVFLKAPIPHFVFPLGTRKQRKILYAVPIVLMMKNVFMAMEKVKKNEYVFPSYKNKDSHIKEVDYALKELKPSFKADGNIVLGNIKRVETFTAKTLRRTWTQVGVILGYDLNILNYITGRSSKLKSSTAIGTYISSGLETSVPYFEKIIMALTEGSEVLENMMTDNEDKRIEDRKEK